MRSFRIFISHSAKETETHRFLQTLSARLQEKKNTPEIDYEDVEYDVLLDEERLEYGSRWRDEIYTWMGLSDGAVILLSPSALREDPEPSWVFQEGSILKWRQNIQSNFIIIPVYMGGVAPEALKQHKLFKELQLTELQGHVLSEGLPQEEVIEAINKRFTEKLKPLPRDNVLFPIEYLAETIAEWLKNITDNRISTAAEKLHIDLKPWHPGDTSRYNLALKMLLTPLQDSFEALRILLDPLDEETARNIFYSLAPSWVNTSAALWLALCATASPKKPIVILNATEEWSLEQYVFRACSRPPRSRWKIHHVPDIGANKRELLATIEELLISRMPKELRTPDAEENRRRLREWTKTYNKKQTPVCVVLNCIANTDHWLQKLPEVKEALPDVAFLICTGDTIPAKTDPEIYKSIEPPLTQVEEKQAMLSFYQVRDNFFSGTDTSER
jgi:hypothetical protein